MSQVTRTDPVKAEIVSMMSVAISEIINPNLMAFDSGRRQFLKGKEMSFSKAQQLIDSLITLGVKLPDLETFKILKKGVFGASDHKLSTSPETELDQMEMFND